MLRACLVEMKGNWEEHLSLIEFAYNNNYQATIEMALYKLLCVGSVVPHSIGRKLASIVYSSKK